MAIAVNKNLILKKAKRIRTVPPVNIVRSYRFERKNEYKKFVKWISSADGALKRKKDKLPKKKDIKGLAINTSSALQGLAMILMGLLIDSKNPEENVKKIVDGAKKAAVPLAIGGAIATPFIAKHLLKKFLKPSLVKPVATNVLPQIIKGPARKCIIRKVSGEVAEGTVKKKVSQQVGKKLTQQVAKKVGPKAARFIPGFGSLIAAGFAAHEFSQGDVVGGSLALMSAIPILGWAAIGVDIARDLGAFEGTPIGLNESEKKEQTKDLQEGMQTDIQTQQVTDIEQLNNTFVTAVDKFGIAVSDFKKMSVGMSFGIGKPIITAEGVRDLIGSEKNDGYIGPKWLNITTPEKNDGYIGPKSWGIVTPPWLGGETNKTIEEQNNNMFKKFWNWFVPPAENSNEPSVRAGIRTPQTGFKHVESISNGNQLFGAGNNSVIMVPDETIVQSNSGSGMIPIPIPTGGGGGVAVVTPSETEILNSLWTNILLTKLAQ